MASLDIVLARDTVDLGDTLQLKVVAHDAEGNVVENHGVKWTVQSGEGWVAVDERGKAVVVQAPRYFLSYVQMAVVQADAGGVVDVDTLYVAHAPARIRFSNSALIRVGRTRELIATFYDESEYNLPRRPVRWSSSNSAVAAVTQNGVLSAVREGTATITASIAGVSVSQELRVVTGGYALAVLGPGAAYDLNDAGQVVGASQNHAFSWRNGLMRDIGGSAAYGVNNQGVIVGLSGGPVRWENDVPVRLATPEGVVHGAAFDVDEQGRILVHNYSDRAVSFWADGDTTNISSGRQWLSANGMNRHGAVAGSAWGGDPYHAVLLQNGSVQSLRGSRIAAQASAVNDLGDVAGFYHRHPITWRVAFLRKGETMVTLGQLGGDYMEAWNLNERAEVVGWGQDARDQERGFVWYDGVLAELTDLLDTPGWVVLRAHAINESGQIAGEGMNAATGERAAILLSPLP